ncbi:MAG: PSD1 and planctomycete cytochrome C domain-containing protein [Verrucomicrobiales bacterium]
MRLYDVFSAAFLSAASVLTLGAEESVIQFNRDIRPILSDNCFACHGFDAKTREAGLRLDVPDGEGGALVASPEGVVPIKPGDPGGSEVWRRLTSTSEDDIMPPPKAHKTLSSDQKETIRRWISQGAPYQRHWAFEPPLKPSVPEIEPADPARGAIDAFLLERLQRDDLSPSPEADRETLIRRVTLALTGLPPTLAEIDAFLADPAPYAYERVVDRLLASPHFGEQMARHWLDVARYGDTHGLHLDNERSMWPYRDWVVSAFNRNLPFDQFTIEQIGGDLLPEPRQDQLVATGFSRCNVTTGEGGSIDSELLFRYAVDRTSTVVQAWMGLTAGCAVCHDHKFDPLSTKEFYSLYAFFYSAADPAMDGNQLLTAPTIKLKLPADDAKQTELAKEIDALEARRRDTMVAVNFQDPAAQDPPPSAQIMESVWIEDGAPEGASLAASPGHPTQWVTAEIGPVFSGQQALKRTDAGLAQDVVENAVNPPLVIPPSGRLFAHVFLDPGNLPRAIMLQYYKSGWQHRAVWGDYEVIGWGAANTTERVSMGALPTAGQWVRLEFPAEQVGLKPGDQVTAFAFTQFGGTVFWDRAGVVSSSDPASDPAHSMIAWLGKVAGSDPPKDLPEPVREALRRPAAERTSDDAARLREHYLLHINAQARAAGEPLAAEVAALKKQRDDHQASLPGTFIMRDLDPPRQAHIMERGAYDRPGEPVDRAVPAIFSPLKNEPGKIPNRLDLARWLVAPENPLTARVTVNRFWQQFFGIGLVKTGGDFGSQGEAPSHPELLDWLAVDFRESGWDVNRLVRMLVTSRAWRQSSVVAEPARDPENRLVGRAPRLRLDAEEMRDQALATSGLLNLTMGGKGVRPYQPPKIWEPVGFTGSNTATYTQDTGQALYRRSLYTFFKRTAPPPFMTNFDAPNREQICTGRERSNTPLQALQLMNDVQYFEAARSLAERILTEGGTTAADRLAWGFRTVVARPPRLEESAILAAHLDQQRESFRQDPERAAKVIDAGESTPRPGLDPAELAAWTLVGNLLLNLDEVVTRN